MTPFQIDPSWYERHWLHERPPSRWAPFRNRLARALTSKESPKGRLP